MTFPPPFADGSAEPWWVAGTAALFSALGAITTIAVAQWLKWRQGSGDQQIKEDDAEEARQARRDSATVRGLKLILDRQEAHITRLQRQVEQQQETINRQQAMHGECRERYMELHGFCRLIHSIARRAVNALEAGGQMWDSVPDLPPVQPTHAEEAEFIARQAAEATKMGGAVTEQLATDSSLFRQGKRPETKEVKAPPQPPVEP